MSARPPVKESPDPQLVAAARAAVVKHGYAGLTLERIAAEADVSRVTLHRRGCTKDDVFTSLITQMFEEHRDALWPALTAAGSGADRLAKAVATVCDLCERDLPLLLAARAHVDVVRNADDDHGSLSPMAVMAEPFMVLARDGIADGSLRDGDPEVLGPLMANWAGTTYVNLRAIFGWGARRARGAVVEHVCIAFAAS